MQTADRTIEMAPDAALALGRYRLVRRLGHGAFGVVWLAHDERLDRMVAVKRIEIHDEHVAARAEREALAAARLSHPAVVTLHEAGRDDDAVHLVSELVSGPTLADLMEAGALSDRDVLRIGVALCQALEHAHARGIVHRDVKPANVMIPERPAGEASVAKLTDFGVAAVAGDGGLTRTGDVVGTLAYMAPEQAAGAPVTGSADLYALALVLYEALAGVNPVRAPGAAATARRVGMRMPPLTRQRPDLPTALAEAIDRALLPDSSGRGSVAELRSALERGRSLAGTVVGPVARPRRGDRGRVTIPGRAAPEDPWKARAGGAAAAPPVSSRLLAGGGAAALCAAGLALLPASQSLSPGLIAAVIASAALVVAALPRAGWIVLMAGMALALGAAGLGGVGVLVVAAVLPTVIALPLCGALWSAPAAGPLAAAAGVAIAWPALAGQAASVRSRAALGALGLWWCLLAEQSGSGAMLLGALPGAPDGAAWKGSAEVAAREVLWPLLTSGALLLAVPWAVAAAVLPLAVRGRWLAIDIVAATAWAVGLAAATVAVASAIAWPGGRPEVHGVVSGALLGALLALLAAGLRAPRGDGALP